MKKTIDLLRSKWREYLIEMAVIIIGILLAIALNNWNEYRKDRQKEKQFLQQIHNEFLQNKKQLEEVITFHREILNECEKIIQLFPIKVDSVNLDSLGLSIRKSGRWTTFDPSQGTIDALISTSSFDVISDKQLRMLLLTWKGNVKDYFRNEQNTLDRLNTIYNPYRLKNIFTPLTDSRMNLSVLQSFEFENQLRRRRADILNLLHHSAQLHKMQKDIEEIIFLTKPK